MKRILHLSSAVPGRMSKPLVEGLKGDLETPGELRSVSCEKRVAVAGLELSIMSRVRYVRDGVGNGNGDGR